MNKKTIYTGLILGIFFLAFYFQDRYAIFSIDDWTYVCNKLNVQIDGCDTFTKWLLPTCPIERGEQDG